MRKGEIHMKKKIVSLVLVFALALALGIGGTVAWLTAQTSEVVLTGDDVKKAEYQYGQISETGPQQAYVQLTLRPEAVEKWATATREAIGGQIIIMMDDIVISAPTVNEEINSDTCTISGDFTPETAQQLANQINSGALPFSLRISKQETVAAK